MAAAFWKPGAARPGSFLDRASEQEDALDAGAIAGSLLSGGSSLQAQKARLPITKHKDAILYALEKYPVLIVIGETGCGKTTRE